MADIEHTSREVIQNKLLTALNDESKVAILATRDELDVLIACFEIAREQAEGAWTNKIEEYFQDLKQLRKSAFEGS